VNNALEQASPFGPLEVEGESETPDKHAREKRIPAVERSERFERGKEVNNECEEHFKFFANIYKLNEFIK